jgi:hypothetical protein
MRTWANWASVRALAVVAGTLLSGAGMAQAAPPRAASAAVSGAPAGTNGVEAAARFDGHKVAGVRVASMRDLQTLRALSDDLWSCGPIKVPEGGAAEVPARFSLSQFEALKASGLAYRVLIDDVQALIDAEHARLAPQQNQGARGDGAADGPGWFADYKNYQQISDYVDTLAALRPDLVSRVTLGNSLQGRAIFGMKITSGAGGPNKPGVFYHAMQHAREWITGASVMYVADQLTRNYDSDPEIHRLLDTFEVYIVPISNPDGYAYTWSDNRLWRKNRRPNAGGSFGVDNNRNWGIGWGGEGSSSSPSNETYRGTGPFSEPETQVLRDFVLSKPNLVFGMDVHSYAQLVLSAYGYTIALPPDRAMFAEIDAGLVQALGEPFGTQFVGGPTYTTIYPASGVSSDWLYDGAHLIGYGVELRDTGQFGFVLPPDQIVPSGMEVLNAVEYVGDWLIDHAVKFSFVTPLPGVLTPGVPTPLSVNIFRGTTSPVPGTQTLYYRIGTTGLFTAVAMTATDADSYGVSLPSGPCNALVQFYFSTQTASGITVTDPAGGAAAPYVAAVTAPSVVVSDGGETNTGWTMGVAGDTATSGQWTRGDPNGTVAQPENAYAGSSCFFTGQGPVGGADGTADVDNGFTTLVTPALNLAGMTGVNVSYARWYDDEHGAAPGQDVFTVSVSSDNGAHWTTVETVGPGGSQTSGGWFVHSFALTDFVPATSQVRLRFVADDENPGSLVEAAIDELRVTVSTCGTPCVADWNRDGTVNSTDVSDMINTWFEDQANGTLNADFNHDGTSNSTDVSDFINAWFEPC